jgi:hypothetical protein
MYSCLSDLPGLVFHEEKSYSTFPFPFPLDPSPTCCACIQLAAFTVTEGALLLQAYRCTYLISLWSIVIAALSTITILRQVVSLWYGSMDYSVGTYQLSFITVYVVLYHTSDSASFCCYCNKTSVLRRDTAPVPRRPKIIFCHGVHGMGAYVVHPSYVPRENTARLLRIPA